MLETFAPKNQIHIFEEQFCMSNMDFYLILKKHKFTFWVWAEHRGCAAGFALLNLPKGKSLGRSKPETNSSNEQAH